jgi:hypothetical protein
MTYKDLPEGYATFYRANNTLLITPEGYQFTYPPDTHDAVIWEAAWECKIEAEEASEARERWYCGDPFCWFCVEDGRVSA